MKFHTMIASALIALLGVLAISLALPASAQDDDDTRVTIETTTTKPMPQSLVTLQVTTVCVKGNPLLEVAISNDSHLPVVIIITVDDEPRTGLVIEPMSAIYPKWKTNPGTAGTILVQVDYNDADPGTFTLTQDYQVMPCPVPTAIDGGIQVVNDDFYTTPSSTVPVPEYMSPAPPAEIKFTG